MSTYRELIYMVLDKLKENTDDSYFKEEHVAFLLDKYRPLLLKQRYSDIRKSVSQNNYCTFKLQLNQGNGVDAQLLGVTQYYTTLGRVLYSNVLMPRLVSFNDEIEEFKVLNIAQEDDDSSQLIGDFSVVSTERFKYVGENKWLKKFIYVTIGPDYKLYVKIQNDAQIVPTEILIQGILEDPKKAKNILIPAVSNYLDMQYPLEDALIPPLLDMVVKDLGTGLTAPEDRENNSKDDVAQPSPQQQTQR